MSPTTAHSTRQVQVEVRLFCQYKYNAKTAIVYIDFVARRLVLRLHGIGCRFVANFTFDKLIKKERLTRFKNQKTGPYQSMAVTLMDKIHDNLSRIHVGDVICWMINMAPYIIILDKLIKKERLRRFKIRIEI